MKKETNSIPILPDYHNCLVNLANSMLAEFSAPTTADTLKLADRYLKGDHKNIVLLVLDAMGISILEKHLNKDGFFRRHLTGSFDSVYPPTTVAATTSLLSGLYPNEHGWLGWDMYYPKLDKNVTVFTNSDQLTEKENAEPVSVSEDGTKIWDEDSLKEALAAAQFHAGFTFTPYQTIVDKITAAGGNAYFSMPFMPPHPQDLDAILKRVRELCALP
ncbi:MAG: alkaline phosphatase family protein, partial [Lachnospiraceae bacterium]|nr:alkaline phosphatase family protein [Lachnospiraceae bacterium]